jgi:hypothetical protein
MKGGQVLRTLEAFDSATNTWTTKASMPTARHQLGTSVVNGLLYAVGGAGGPNDTVPLGTVEAYDPASDTWTSKPSMPTARYGLGTSMVNGIIYAVGGAGGASDTGILGTVEAYDPASDTWTSKTSMPTARRGLGTSVVNGVIYAAGGGNNNGILATLEAYDPGSNSWTTDASMSTARFYPGDSAVNGVIYVIGGGNNVGTVEAFTPANPYVAQVSQPINSDGSSVFNVKRGVVPVKFTLTYNGVPTCNLPAASISLTRTAGAVLGSIDESQYLLASDSGSSFRIDSGSCQYIYNLAAGSLGTGTYTVNISIGGIVIGSGIFGLK